MTAPPPRALLVAAAVLWSLSALFVRVLREPTGLGLESPALSPVVIAVYRNLFAGLMLLAFIPRAEMRLGRQTAGVVACFAVMSGLYIAAVGQGGSANAILLKYTAPLWVALATVAVARERLDRRNIAAVLVGVSGALVIVAGNWPRGSDPAAGSNVAAILMALGSGVAYAGIVLVLGSRGGQSPAWLNAAGLVGSGVVLAGVVAVRGGAEELIAPSGRQFAWLALFAAVQMAIPYRLFTRGLRDVRPQEAGVLTLLEPVLTPVWVFLLLPSRETPAAWTLGGGAVMLAALAVRYLPTRGRANRGGHSG